MVLEEEIVINAHDCAQELVTLLRQQGISAKIRTSSTLMPEMGFTGTYRSLIQAFEEAVYGEEAESEPDEENISQFREAIGTLTEMRDNVASVFESYKPGDKYGTSVTDLFIGKTELAPDEVDKIPEIIREITIASLLRANNLMEMQGDSMILTGTMPADDLKMSFPAQDVPVFDEEILENNQIISKVTISDIFSYTVIIGPEIIFTEDISEIEDFIEKLVEEDEEEVLEVLPRIHFKRILISEIINLISEKNITSREEIIATCSHLKVELTPTTIWDYHLSPEYLASFIDDLKKSGIIKGKDQRLKLVR